MAHTEAEQADWSALLASWLTETLERRQSHNPAFGGGHATNPAFGGQPGHSPYGHQPGYGQHGYGQHDHGYGHRERRGPGRGAVIGGAAAGAVGGMIIGDMIGDAFEDDGGGEEDFAAGE